MNINDIAKYVDRTNLKADATREDIIKLCDDAKMAGNASVCVNSYYTALVSNQLADSDVSTCVVVGFPLGAMSTKSKAFEAKCAVEDGADEIDMVINVGALKDKKYNMVEEDIYQVVESAKPAILKVIIEACLLTDDEKVKACELALKAGAAFVKTSTGFSTGGATVEDVVLMRKTVGDKAGVKAAGGIRTVEAAEQMLNAGANRIGASNIK